jgi:hypothetical protein
VLATVAVWAASLAALGLRLRGVLLAKRFAWSCLGLFVAALLSLVPVDKSRHPVTKPMAGDQSGHNNPTPLRARA